MPSPDQDDDDDVFNSRQFLAPFKVVSVNKNLSRLYSAEGNSDKQITFSDSEIVAMWVETGTSNPATRRIMRKEGERLILYGAFVICKHLREIDAQDIEHFMDFTADPKPTEKWVSVTKWPRHDSRWRPFAGPLCKRSRRLTINILKGLFRWMKVMKLIGNNPVSDVRRAFFSSPPLELHVLPNSGMNFVYRAIEAVMSTRKRVRNRFLVTLFFSTAITPYEAISANMNDINTEAGKMTISRNGHKTRSIPIPQNLLDELTLYRTTFELSPKIENNKNLPLLLTANSKYKRLSYSAVTYCISTIMKDAAQLARLEGANKLGDILQRASIYWLHHTHLRNLAENGSELLAVNKIAGHSNLNTTKKYFDTDFF